MLSSLLLAACAPQPPDFGSDEDVAKHERPFASAHATLVTMEFDGELAAPWQADAKKLVKSQLLYTVGQLNAHHSVGRLDKVVLTNVKKLPNGDGWMKVTYHASLPVGWGDPEGIPDELTLTLPRRIGPQSLQTFTTNYSETCVEESGHVVTSGNFWYHFRPAADGCALDPAHVVTTKATLTESPANTTGKFPEYDKIHEDGVFRAVLVFGKYEDYAKSPSDAGIAAYNDFVDSMRTGWAKGFTTVPAVVPPSPGVAVPDVAFEGEIDGRKVSVTALLIDSPKVATAAFDARYAKLTKTADLIAYDGHAGLGANVAALAQKGSFQKGQYVVFFMNGCDTFAYLDDTLWKRFAKLNPGDPLGTKHLDMLVNLMPSYFQSSTSTSLSLLDALARYDAPRTYEQIFSGIDPEQVVAAVGEEDNDFVPSAQPFDGMWASGLLERGESHAYDTGLLPAGTYTIRIEEAKPSSAGDVDLYVGIGYPPTLELWDERPYLYGSDEEVTVTLAQPSVVHVMLHGWEEAPAKQSHYALSIE